MTLGDYVTVESGLEHDLVRRLDRDTRVTHLVSQPARLHFPLEPGRVPSHTPDLLSVTDDGEVTVWDARPIERQDELFLRRSALTREACLEVGWDYQLFAGWQPTAARMNELWLAGYRRSKPWHDQRVKELSRRLGSGPTTIASVLAAEDGTGELVETMWHLIWGGQIRCALDRPINATTELLRIQS